VRLEEPENGQPENVMEQAERPSELKMSVEVWISVAQCGPRMDRKHGSAEAWNPPIRLCCNVLSCVRRVTGIEPALSAWELTVSRGTRQEG
jgi:hypothetical protein